jgi:predicted esterase
VNKEKAKMTVEKPVDKPAEKEKSPSVLKLPSETFSVDLPMRYLFEESQASDDKLVIFLHGYTDHGPSMARRVLRGQSLGLPWLAPNAPFPVPVRTEEGFREAYSWYFKDLEKNEIYISPEIASKMLVQLLERLNLVNREMILVGFSQGGFFAPYLAQHLKNVKKVIGVGAAYRLESYKPPQTWPLDVIHGLADEIVPLSRTQETIEKLKAKGQEVNLTVLPEARHEVGREISAHILKSIRQVWP